MAMTFSSVRNAAGFPLQEDPKGTVGLTPGDRQYSLVRGLAVLPGQVQGLSRELAATREAAHSHARELLQGLRRLHGDLSASAPRASGAQRTTYGVGSNVARVSSSATTEVSGIFADILREMPATVRSAARNVQMREGQQTLVKATASATLDIHRWIAQRLTSAVSLLRSSSGAQVQPGSLAASATGYAYGRGNVSPSVGQQPLLRGPAPRTNSWAAGSASGIRPSAGGVTSGGGDGGAWGWGAAAAGGAAAGAAASGAARAAAGVAARGLAFVPGLGWVLAGAATAATAGYYGYRGYANSPATSTLGKIGDGVRSVFGLDSYQATKEKNEREFQEYLNLSEEDRAKADKRRMRRAGFPPFAGGSPDKAEGGSSSWFSWMSPFAGAGKPAAAAGNSALPQPQGDKSPPGEAGANELPVDKTDGGVVLSDKSQQRWATYIAEAVASALGAYSRSGGAATGAGLGQGTVPPTAAQEHKEEKATVKEQAEGLLKGLSGAAGRAIEGGLKSVGPDGRYKAGLEGDPTSLLGTAMGHVNTIEGMIRSGKVELPHGVGPGASLHQPWAPWSGGVNPGNGDYDMMGVGRKGGGGGSGGKLRSGSSGGGGGSGGGKLSSGGGGPAGPPDQDQAKLLEGVSENGLKFIRSIGVRETGFRDSEAGTDANNQPHNNSNVRRAMESGMSKAEAMAKFGDYGYFQTNQNDVEQAIKLGVDPEVAKALNNGGGTGKYTPEQQTRAMHEYLKRLNPQAYAAAEAGDFDTANEAFKGKWPSLPGGKSYHSHLDKEAGAVLGGKVTKGMVTPSTEKHSHKDGDEEQETQYENGRIPPEKLTDIGDGHKLHGAAAVAWKAMREDAAKEGVDLKPTDSYRDYDAQVDVAKRKGLYSQGGLAAKPGHSKHGLGKAVDVHNTGEDGEKATAWLRKNGAKYGFKTIPREPWHWQYEGGYKPAEKPETAQAGPQEKEPTQEKVQEAQGGADVTPSDTPKAEVTPVEPDVGADEGKVRSPAVEVPAETRQEGGSGPAADTAPRATPEASVQPQQQPFATADMRRIGTYNDDSDNISAIAASLLV